MKAQAIALREEGATISEIAAALDIGRSTAGELVAGIDPLPHALAPVEERDAESERLQTLRKHCARCGESKPWAEFWAVAKWSDGTMRRPQSHCRVCVKARRRARRKADPELARERDRREWQRLMADPVRRERRRETQRENSVVFRRRQVEERAELGEAA